MTPLQVMEAFRLRVDDTSGDVGAPVSEANYWEEDDSQCLWSNVEITSYLNDALYEFGVRNPIRDGDTEAVVSDTNEYTYDSGIIAVRSVRYGDDKYLCKKLQADFDRTWPNWRTDTSVRYFYAEDHRRRKIILPFVPASATALYLTVDRVPAETTFANRKTDTLEVDRTFKEALVQGMMMYAYGKRDSDTFQPDLQAKAEAKFSQLVGPPVSAKQLEAIRMNANWHASVLGNPYFGGCNRRDDW